MSETKFDICTRALQRVGCKAIASFDDGTTESMVAGKAYDPLVEAKLTSHPWRFATKQFALNLLAAEPVGTWAYQFQAPDGCLAVQAVKKGGHPIEFDRLEDKIVTDSNSALVADYTFRPDEGQFPAYFRDALVCELAAIFVMSLKRNAGMAAELQDRADSLLWPQARHRDSKQQTTRRIAPSRLVSARF